VLQDASSQPAGRAGRGLLLLANRSMRGIAIVHQLRKRLRAVHKRRGVLNLEFREEPESR
jgi:hypothetical protein